YLSSRLTVCLGIGGLQLRAWSAGAASCGSRYVHQGCQSLPATANSSGLTQPPCAPPNMGASEGGRNQRTQPALSRGTLLPCGAVGPSRAQQNCVLCSLGGAGMRSLFCRSDPTNFRPGVATTARASQWAFQGLSDNVRTS